MREVNLPPYAPNLIESTRSIGYSFEMALADIVDNSISNFADRVDVRFSDETEPFVAVIDDGTGMTAGELEAAMRYGSVSSQAERETTDLGRFGLGLKMASMSQCRRLTVITKCRGKMAAAQWDLDRILETKEWSLATFSGDELQKLRFHEKLDDYESGTVVLWEHLDRIAESPVDFKREFDARLDFADRHLSLVFHRFLEDKRQKDHLDLYFNNRLLEPIDPFMRSNPATQPLEPETLFVNDVPIIVKPYIMPYVSKLSAEERRQLDQYKDLNLKQGLYIYRNKRLIAWGKWFRLLSDNDLQRLTRVQIDLPNNIDDDWSIDVKKSSAQIPSGIKERLAQIVRQSVGKSERVYKYRGARVNADNNEHVWNRIENRGKIQYMVNKDSPIFKAMAEKLNDDQNRMLNSFVKSLEDVFPYGAVYFDLAKDKEYTQNTLPTEEAYAIAKETVEGLSHTPQEAAVQVKNLAKIDLFQKYPEVIRMLEKEYNHD